MDCHEAQKFIHAYLDQEFGEKERQEMSAHLQGCERCRNVANFEERFRRRLRKSQEPVTAPPRLRASVRKALEKAAPEEAGSRTWLWRMIPVAAAVALVVGTLLTRQQEPRPLNDLATQSVAWHRQKLPMDVTGPGFEAVRRFFSNKVPFAVRPAFKSPRAKLIGARLSNLGARQAAYLTYQVGPDRVSVFIVDPNSIPAGGNEIRRGRRTLNWHGLKGYNVLTYVSGGTGYAVASDMDQDRLIRLVSHSD